MADEVRDFFNITQASREKGVSRQTLYNNIIQGKLLAVTIGDDYVIPARSLALWNPDPDKQRAGRASAESRARKRHAAAE